MDSVKLTFTGIDRQSGRFALSNSGRLTRKIPHFYGALTLPLTFTAAFLSLYPRELDMQSLSRALTVLGRAEPRGPPVRRDRAGRHRRPAQEHGAPDPRHVLRPRPGRTGSTITATPLSTASRPFAAPTRRRAGPEHSWPTSATASAAWSSSPNPCRRPPARVPARSLPVAGWRFGPAVVMLSSSCSQQCSRPGVLSPRLPADQMSRYAGPARRILRRIWVSGFAHNARPVASLPRMVACAGAGRVTGPCAGALGAELIQTGARSTRSRRVVSVLRSGV